MKHYLNEFLRHISATNTASDHTRDAYSRDVTQFLDFLDESDDLLSLDTDIAYNYLNELYNAKLSSTSVARKISTLRSFFKFLQMNYGAQINPFSSVKIKQGSRSLPNYLTVEEMNALLLSCSDDNLGIRNQVLIELMYACGLRLQECTNLKMSDISIRDRKLSIIGKGNKERTLFFYESLAIKLDNYIKVIRPQLLKDKQNDTLFLNTHGNPISRRGVQFVLEKQGKEANLRMHLHPHMLRHSFATHLLDNGANLRIVQTLLGHETLSTTQIYAHVSLSKIKDAYDSAMKNLPLT